MHGLFENREHDINMNSIIHLVSLTLTVISLILPGATAAKTQGLLPIMDAVDDDGYGPRNPSTRLYLKNLSFNVNKAHILTELRHLGFNNISLDGINIVRKGPALDMVRFCTAFVTMENLEDVDRAISVLHGKLMLSMSPRPLHAERALPRLKSLRQAPICPAQAQASQMPTTTEEAPLSDPAADSEGRKFIGLLSKVKEELQEFQSDEEVNIEAPLSDPAADSEGRKFVGLLSKAKEEKQQFESNASEVNIDLKISPWKRRKTLRGEDS